MKATLKSKTSIMAIITLLIGLTFAIIKNGGLDGIIINVPGSDPIEVELPEGCDCNECICEEDKCACDGDGCSCPNCVKPTE
jgi:hypothetical protein|tara:strand:+ start:575 stop:820 length:246 start_codon:yes stop_codon:yes gene_type:complete